MREVKFRGKRFFNGGWAEGSLVLDKDGSACIIDYANHETETYTWEDVDPSTVGQYTGLKDKNGKDIYEGDILNWDYSGETEFAEWMKSPVYYVTYEEGYRLCAKSLDSSKKLYLHAFRFKHTEVISNIHDSPELLK